MSRDPRSVDELSPKLEAALLREVQATWRAVNKSLFHGAMKPPSFAVSHSATSLGSYAPATRTLTLAVRPALTQPWGAVVEVIKHEMAHQYVFEILQVRDETAHGAAFRSVCASYAIDARAYGVPDDTGETSDEARVLRRVHKLLALATSSNMHEAESAMQHAQRLMLEHNLDVDARNLRQGYRVAQLGRPTTRMQAHVKLLGGILGEHFFVEVIIVQAYDLASDTHGSVLEICGRPENVAMASYVHDFLLRTAEALWLEHRRVHGSRGPLDRRRFICGVVAGFGDKLVAEERVQQERGLVWRGDAQLDDFFDRRHPHVRQSRVRAHRDEAHAHGRVAGAQIVLSRPIDEAPMARGRQLRA